MIIDYHLPRNKRTSNDLLKKFETFNKEKFEKKIGIYERRYSSKTETSLELGVKSAKKVLKKFDKEIDFILFCTQTPKHLLPGNSSQLQSILGLKNIPSFDINLGCSGYVYGLSIAQSLIRNQLATNLLFITADTYTKFINERDKSNLSIFGDGAAATIITKDDVENFGNFVLGSDGNGSKELIIKNGVGFSKTQDCEIKKYGDDNFYTDNDLYMNGINIFNFTIDLVPQLVSDTLERNNIKIEEIDLFVFHQANSFMLEFLRKRIGIKKERFYNNLKLTGNTVSSTIPIALTDLTNQGQLIKGMKVMLVGFGVGLSWGATIIKY